MIFELPPDGEEGVGNRVFRACRGAGVSYIHLSALEIKTWFLIDKQITVFRAELMKLGEDDPLADSAKQALLEDIILELGRSHAVMVYRQKNHLRIFTSEFSDEFWLTKLHAELTADHLRDFAIEIARCKTEL